MRYSVATALAPQAAIAYAKDYFGPRGVGLEVIDDHDTCVTLQGGWPYRGGRLRWCSTDDPGAGDTRVGLSRPAIHAGGERKARENCKQ